MTKLRRLSLILLVVCFFISVVCLLNAQVVTPTALATDFGNVNTCGDKTAVGPCSTTRTLTYTVTEGGMVGKPAVLTLGAAYLDFTLAGGTCNGSVATASTCTVVVKFTPRFAGLRTGAAQIVDQSGKVLATTFVHGVGAGPQAVISGVNPVSLVTAQGNVPNSGVAVDGSGNVFFSTGGSPHVGMPSAVMEYPAEGGALITAATGFGVPQGVAMDGAGDLYVADVETNRVLELPRGCTTVSCATTIDGGFFTPYGVAVDGAGTVYVADSGNNRVLAMPGGCTTRACAQTVGSGLNFPYSVAVDGSGTVLIADLLNQRIVRVLAGGKQSTMAANLGTAYGVAVDAADDILITDYAHQQIVEEPRGGGAVITLISLSGPPIGIAVDGTGNIFFTAAANTAGVSELKVGPLPLHTFANAATGTTSGDSPLNDRVQNVGNAVLSLTSVKVGPNFTQVEGERFDADDCKSGHIVWPGGICNLSLSFTPTVNGPLTGSAVLTDNSLNATGATQTVPLAGAGAPGQVIDYSGGFGAATSTMLLNGGATISSNTLQLTDGGTNESRSAFFSTPASIASFSADFDFVLRGKTTSIPDGDGFTFVLQANGPDALGSGGGGLGYGLPGVGLPGAKITNSVAVKFDLQNDAGEGTSSIGLYVNGAAPTVPSINLLGNDVRLHSGHPFHATVIYDGSVLTVFLSDQLEYDSVGVSFPIDLGAMLGGQTAYVGFTGSTGAETAVQNILDFSMTSFGCCTSGTPQFVNGFGSAGDLVVNGAAAIAGGALMLTNDTPLETSSAWFPAPVPVSRFTSDFDFQLTRGDGEGFTFAVQSEGPHAIGSAAGGLGYGADPAGSADTAIAHSVAVKFDLNSESGEGSNSTGVYSGGASPTVPSTNLALSGINLHSGHTFHARLSYDGVNLSVNITDLMQYAVFSGSYPVDIATEIGGTQAYAGFTAATGSLVDTVKILNWNMSYY